MASMENNNPLTIQISLANTQASTRRIPIEREEVVARAHRVVGKASDDAAGRQRPDTVAEGRGAGVAFEGREVGGQAGDMGGGHGSPRDGVLG